MMKVVLSFILVLFATCTTHVSRRENSAEETKLLFSKCSTDQGSYLRNSIVKLSCIIRNPSNATIRLKDLKVKLRNISQGTGFFKEILLDSDLTIAANKDFSIDSLPMWQVAQDAATDAYGVYVSYVSPGGTETTVYQTFFRVVDKNILTTYVINKEAYQGVITYALDGGMSAEYTVEKAIENLSSGVAHSWQVNAPGSGPRPVYATPQFLKNAVERTVALYNTMLGQNTEFETVILSSGFPAVPNLSHALKAPVLPLHFLVSANTIKEIKTIMDYSNQNGFKSYTTLGYDLSVPTAVAWIKLLDLPEAYLTFLKQHHVKNILLMGATGINEGETRAKQILSQSEGKYAPGSIYILYPGNTADDLSTLQQKIRDINEFSQQRDYTKIADWESGIINDQISNINTRIKGTLSINVYTITADDLINLYNLGTYATLALFKKNNLIPTGIAVDPYLLSHSAFESYKGFIPFNYWQLVSPSTTVNRLKSEVKQAMQFYFPQVAFEQLAFWVNSSNNLGGAPAAENLISTLRVNGMSHITTNDYTKDEVWNPSDGMDTPCERIAIELAQRRSFDDFKRWNAALVTLTVPELIAIAQHFGGFVATKMN